MEKRSEPRQRNVDVKDYGEIKHCTDYSGNMLSKLAKVWDLTDAKRLYVLAILRAAYGDVKNRDIQMHYETSFLSEFIPGVHLSENTISKFLEDIGKAYTLISVACFSEFFR